MEWGARIPKNVQIHYLLKGKNRKNVQENEKARKKLKNPRQTGDARPCHPGHTAVHHHMGRGGPHGQPVVVSGRSGLRRFSNVAFCALFDPQVFALDHVYWAYWASFSNFFDLLSPQLHSFSYYLTHHT